MKTKEELNALKQEVEVMNPPATLSEDELAQVAGGFIAWDSCAKSTVKTDRTSYKFIVNVGDYFQLKSGRIAYAAESVSGTSETEVICYVGVPQTDLAWYDTLHGSDLIEADYLGSNTTVRPALQKREEFSIL